MPGNIFANSIICGIFEIVIFVFSCKVYKKLGLRRSFCAGFAFAIMGSFGLLIADHNREEIPIMILMCRVGIAYITNIMFLAFSILFPPIFSPTSLGISKLIGRVVTIFAPILAEVDGKAPMIIFTLFSVMGASAGCFLITKEDKDT